METTRMNGATAMNESRKDDAREIAQGDPELLDLPVAQQLLQSTIPARVAYLARDGTPRVVPVLFHWTGQEVVFTSWPDDPKVEALQARPAVAVTIDTNAPPFKSLSIRGDADVTITDGLAAECSPTFIRYLGPEQGRNWTEMMRRMTDRMARVAIRPTWVAVFDFETRFPNGMARRMGGSPA